MTAPYQLLPPLNETELAELAASINEHGVMVPVLVDEDGVVIDGHHRQRIADDLGIDYPVVQRADLSDADKRTLALSLNLHRRHLTRDQKRAVIAASLTADPELSNRQHAERTGASPTTVGAVRDELEDAGQLSNLDSRTSADGRVRPATQPPRPEPAPEPAPLRCPYCEDADQLGAELVMTVAGWACPDCDEVEPEDLADEPTPIDPDEWEPGGWLPPTPAAPVTAPKAAPLTPEQQRERDLIEGDERAARMLGRIHDRWPYFSGLRTDPRREHVLAACDDMTRAWVTEVEALIYGD